MIIAGAIMQYIEEQYYVEHASPARAVTWKNHMLCIWLVCQKSELLCQQAPKIAWCTPDPLRVVTDYLLLWHHSRGKLYGKYMQQSAVSEFSWYVLIYYVWARENFFSDSRKLCMINHQKIYLSSFHARWARTHVLKLLPRCHKAGSINSGSLLV